MGRVHCDLSASRSAALLFSQFSPRVPAARFRRAALQRRPEKNRHPVRVLAGNWSKATARSTRRPSSCTCSVSRTSSRARLAHRRRKFALREVRICIYPRQPIVFFTSAAVCCNGSKTKRSWLVYWRMNWPMRRRQGRQRLRAKGLGHRGKAVSFSRSWHQPRTKVRANGSCRRLRRPSAT